MTFVQRLSQTILSKSRWIVAAASVTGVAAAALAITGLTGFALALAILATLALLILLVERQRYQERLVSDLWRERHSSRLAREEAAELSDVVRQLDRHLRGSATSSADGMSPAQLGTGDSAVIARELTTLREHQHSVSSTIIDSVHAIEHGVPASWLRAVRRLLTADENNTIAFVGSPETHSRILGTSPVTEHARVILLDPSVAHTPTSWPSSAQFRALIIEASDDAAIAAVEGRIPASALRWLPSDAELLEFSARDSTTNASVRNALGTLCGGEVFQTRIGERLHRLVLAIDLNEG